MNTNTKVDPSNLNTSSNGGAIGAVAGNDNDMRQEAKLSDSETFNNNTSYLSTLAVQQQPGPGGYKAADDNMKLAAGLPTNGLLGNDLQQVLARVSNNSISHEGSTVASTMSSSQQGNNINDGNMAFNNFLQMQNNASANNNNNNSDTDTCSTARRRVSKDSLVSRESLNDLAGAGAGGSTGDYLAKISMLAAQQQQQQQMRDQQNFQFSSSNNNNPTLNQSVSQLLNNSFTMNNSSSNPMHQLADIATIGGGAAFNNTNNSNLGGNNNNVNNNMNNPSNLLSSFGLNHNGGVVAGLHHHNPHPAPTKKKNKTKQTFAQKLMNLLSVKECHSAIRWMPNGESFCIVDIKELVEKVLPKYFKEAKYTSFVSIYFIMQVPMDLVQYNSYSNLIFLFLHIIHCTDTQAQPMGLQAIHPSPYGNQRHRTEG